MDENKIFSNYFGTITDKRVTIKHKNGSQDIPLNQVTSVSFFRKQNKPFAIINFIISLVVLIVPFTRQHHIDTGLVIAGIILFIIFVLNGIANYLGNHQIIISTAGKELKPVKVEMSKTSEGREFSDALRKQIIT